MANHKSSIKRIKTNEAARVRNRWHRGRMRTAIKEFRTALDGDDAAKAAEALKAALRQVGITGSRGVLHNNTVSRYTSRLTQAYNRKFNAPAS
jgi:small subunit ribosomal protein S20